MVRSTLSSYLVSDKELQIRVTDRIAYLRINRPPLNTLTPNLMENMIAAHDELAKNTEVRGVILHSENDKFFCNGLDPETMLAAGAKEREEIFRTLVEMAVRMYSFPKLELCAIGGHAMAGGAVLGILCDFRFMSEGKHRYCFSEVRVGLTIPAGLLSIITSVIGPRYARDAAMLGNMYRADEAQAIGLVDRVTTPETLLSDATGFLTELFEIPDAGMIAVKEQLRAPQLAALKNQDDVATLRKFLVGNFEEGLRAVLERRRPNFT